jgi:hypothetical protein
MAEILVGAVGLIVLIFFLTRQKNREERHKHLIKHSEKYRTKVGSTIYREQGTADEKERVRAYKEIKKDPREIALINDSVKSEYISDAIKLQKIINRNEVAYKYKLIIKEMVPNRNSPFTVSITQLQSMAKRTYPSIPFQEIISELELAEVISPRKIDFNTKLESYTLRVDRIYHPKDRDQKGRRILIHNLTIFEYPKELF